MYFLYPITIFLYILNLCGIKDVHKTEYRRLLKFYDLQNIE